MSESGGSTRLQGTQVKAGTFTVNAGVGPKADPNAKIIIEGVKETLQTSHTEKSESLVWQSMSGNGVTEETLKLAQINAKTKFSAPGGIDVQLPAGDPLKQQVQSLSQQPGMAWLNDLSQRKDVNWQQIKLAKDSWSYDQQGLTPAGAAILAIAIAAYTGGMGAEMLGGTAATSTSAATLMGSTVYGAAANAGFAALAASAGVSFVNNGGDIGKTLKDMGSSQNVKGVLTAMATAGVLNALGSTPTATGQTGANAQAISTTQAVDKFAANLMQNVTNNLASAVVSSAINGTPLNEDTMSTALTSALITAGTAQAANNIGAATQNGTLNAYTQAMAHALAGCVGGAATTGNSGGCSAGAVVGELSAGYAKSTGATDANALAFARSMSAVAGALVGGPDSAAAVNIAAQMGANAAANNRLLHSNESTLANKLASSSGGKYTQQQIEDEMRRGSNTAKGETAASNMILDPSADKALGNNPTDPVASTNFDKGAVFNNVGGSVVQVDRDGTSLGSKPGDTGLQAYIQANTGGADSPYKWVTPLPPDPVDPNASIKMKVDQNWNYGGANSAGLSSGFKPDTRTQAEIDKSLSDTTSAIAVLPLAVGAAVVAPEAALLSGGVNVGAQIIKGEGVSPTEALVSTTMGPIGAAVTEAQAVKALIEQGGNAAIATNAGVGAATNLVGDTTTKVLTGQEVTATGAGVAFGAGMLGGAVSAKPAVQNAVTEATSTALKAVVEPAEKK